MTFKAKGKQRTERVWLRKTLLRLNLHPLLMVDVVISIRVVEGIIALNRLTVAVYPILVSPGLHLILLAIIGVQHSLLLTWVVIGLVLASVTGFLLCAVGFHD